MISTCHERNLRKVAKGHGFVNVKYETSSLSQWKQKHCQWHCEIMQSIPHHGNKKEGESPLNLKASQKGNESK